jgi:uncharacterized protein (TIGR03382 family)
MAAPAPPLKPTLESPMQRTPASNAGEISAVMGCGAQTRGVTTTTPAAAMVALIIVRLRRASPVP